MSAVRSLRSLALLLLAAFLLPLPAPGASAGGASIQPGDQVSTPAGSCTLNFVFTGPGGKTLIGTAGHCGELGQTVSTPGFGGFGRIVYDDDQLEDFALIEVNANLVNRVNPAVRGQPTFPTGSTTSAETATGNVVRVSGFGIGFSFLAVTREQRVGVLFSDGVTHYCADIPAIFGDSGGPVLHDATKKALGVVSGIGPTCSLRGPTIEGILAKTAADGFPITLRTV